MEKCLFFDADGTILDIVKGTPEDTKLALQQLRKNGHKTFICTGRSNAFAISKRLGISDEIIEHAQELVSNENVRFEDVVDRLEQSRANMEKEREEARRIREEADRELEKAQKLKADIETLRQKELEDAKGQAVRITEQAKREAYQLLNDLEMLKKQQAKEKNAAEMARRARAVIKKDLNGFRPDSFSRQRRGLCFAASA